jgi:hypothetical protein
MFSPARKVVIVILAIITAIILTWMADKKQEEMISCGRQSVTVHQGDTLESIVRNKCGADAPVQDIIDEVIKINNLVDGNLIRAGWVLQLP